MANDNEFREAFRAVNVTPEFLSSQFADVTGDLMRATVANDPDHAARARTFKRRQNLLQPLKRLEADDKIVRRPAGKQET